MAYWWDSRPNERLWIEITRRGDLGKDLRAPRLGRGGGLTASYKLVPEVAAGDVVVHYRSDLEAIVGASLAVGAARPQAIYWAARGMSARRAHVRPKWLPGVAVPLDHFQALIHPLPLQTLRHREAALMAIRADLSNGPGDGSRLYFPWVPYAGGSEPMRTWQVYLAKLPTAVLDVLPELQPLVAAVSQAAPMPGAVADVDVAGAFDTAAGRSTTASARRSGGSGGQGFAVDQELKVAVEALAMNAATEYFSSDWDVDDVHAGESFDLLCRRSGVELHVEVKGTTTAGLDVLLTPKEVDHAGSHPMALFVLASITATRNPGGGVSVSGGVPRVINPWHIGTGQLAPVGYKYTLPPAD
jgi:hypothetical protein